MRLTVFGATGGVGREVVAQPLDAGHHVTAYLRNPAKLTVTHPNLTVITGHQQLTEPLRPRTCATRRASSHRRRGGCRPRPSAACLATSRSAG